MGHTVALLGTVGSLGTFFVFRAPYKNIWGFNDAGSAFLNHKATLSFP